MDPDIIIRELIEELHAIVGGEGDPQRIADLQSDYHTWRDYATTTANAELLAALAHWYRRADLAYGA